MTESTCAVSGCNGMRRARGYCQHHYNRWYRFGDPLGGSPEPDACRNCGGALGPKPQTGRRSPYCSAKCRRRAEYLRSKDSGRYAETLASKRKPATERDCIECGLGFASKRDDAVLCSSWCQNRWLDQHNPKRCSESDCDRGVRAKGLCIMHWRRLARAEGREKPTVWNERRRANWKKRYALTRGAPDAESFDYREIYDRDGWICGICSDPVDSELKWPDPMSVSLDHVIPVALGGLHIPENAQCAHLTCNVRKGAVVAA